MAKLEGSDLNELLQFIQDLTGLTADGPLKWAPATPTTYVTDTNLGASRARLALQKLERAIPSATIAGISTPRRKVVYILQAFEMPGVTLRVTIDGGEDPNVNERLRGLYDLVDTGVKRSGLDFLQKILPH
ncbi:MAG TPA: hypothetical protein VK828_06830 [Terriglobales bacterium]|jgi:hypothetical protein|nr:hypothetical protein [Terriglobales bacterium]